MAIPFLIPIGFSLFGALAGAKIVGGIKEQISLPQASENRNVTTFDIAKYAVLGLGVYWVARKTGAVK